MPRGCAGSGAQLMAKEGDYAQLRMPSGEMRRVHIQCYATVGQVGNPFGPEHHREGTKHAL